MVPGAGWSATGAAGQNMMAGFPGAGGGVIGGHIPEGFSVMARQGGQGTAVVDARPPAGGQGAGQGPFVGAPVTNGGQAQGGVGPIVSRAKQPGGTREGKVECGGCGRVVTPSDPSADTPTPALFRGAVADDSEAIDAFGPLVGALPIEPPPTNRRNRIESASLSFVIGNSAADAYPV